MLPRLAPSDRTHVPTTPLGFTNRRPSDRFTRQTFDWIEAQVHKLSTMTLTTEERIWLEKRCPYFTPTYLDYLSKVHLKPAEQVTLSFKDVQKDAVTGLEYGALDLSIKGIWAETILYEVPLMAIISEGYFLFTDKQWDYVGQRRMYLQRSCGVNADDFENRARL